MRRDRADRCYNRPPAPRAARRYTQPGRRELLILFRYKDEAVQVIRLIERHRDIASQFDAQGD